MFGMFDCRALAARYFKTLGPQGPPAFWFKFHQACQVRRHGLQAARLALSDLPCQMLGMAVSIAGFIIAHVKFTNQNCLPHAIIGEPLE